MTPEIAGYIAWSLVGLLFWSLACFTAGAIWWALRPKPCPYCKAQLMHQQREQARVIEGGLRWPRQMTKQPF